MLAGMMAAAVLAVLGATAIAAKAATTPVTAAADADVPPSAVEDFTYPGAATILAQKNIKLISGDGNILLVDCTTPADGDIGLLKVWTTEENIGTSGKGLVCFKVYATTGLLNLEVPGVFEIRGDGLKAGTGHDVVAKLETDDGDKLSVDVDPDGSTPVGVGVAGDPATVLLQLQVNG
ncbi:hypothetical protein [Actinoplanes sp. L3-i22]|uniref:hypothetical protein n=1 Tax=Actinoplanes sp. L3-i22 TaxID=2836373 RepID=UPI001C7475DB|nr:hypothetical protein [Actinoplanes sp. L3-i22]BCY13430.1 hypothetical protein L3i22_085180 [Actinoplanes sp. L3-i22]